MTSDLIYSHLKSNGRSNSKTLAKVLGVKERDLRASKDDEGILMRAFREIYEKYGVYLITNNDGIQLESNATKATKLLIPVNTRLWHERRSVSIKLKFIKKSIEPKEMELFG